MNDITSRLPPITPPTPTRMKDPKVEAGVEDTKIRTQDPSAPTAEAVKQSHIKDGVMAEEQLATAFEQVKTFLEKNTQHELELSVDKESGRSVVKVIDSQTGETVRQFPPEEILNLAKNLRENNGLMDDQQV